MTFKVQADISEYIYVEKKAHEKAKRRLYSENNKKKLLCLCVR